MRLMTLGPEKETVKVLALERRLGRYRTMRRSCEEPNCERKFPLLYCAAAGPVGIWGENCEAA